MKMALIILLHVEMGISCLAGSNDVIFAKLKETVIPVIDFRQVTLQESVDYINHAIQSNANSIIRIDPALQTNTSLITWTARDISALQAIKVIASVSDVRIRYLPDHVMLSPFCCPGTNAAVKCPKLTTVRIESKEIIDYISEQRSNSPSTGIPLDEWAKNYTHVLGVRWHNGSSIKIDRMTNTITIVNAPEDIKLFVSIFTEFS